MGAPPAGAPQTTVRLPPAPGDNGSVMTATTSAPGTSIQVQGAYQGSVPNGAVTPARLMLSLPDAIRRGVRYNLGVVVSNQSVRLARAQQLAAAAQLLPDLTGGVTETLQQINLAAEGLRFQLPVPGFHFPGVVGPFNYFDARAAMVENFSATGLYNHASSRAGLRSSELSVQNSRELVTLAVAGEYLQIIASSARVATANAQVETARAVYQQAADRNRSGISARIDVTRSQVELQTQQQRLTSLVNDLEKQKIALARLIGLPLAQEFALSDTIPRRELTPADLESLILQAVSTRPDVQSAESQVKAAELARRAAVAERFPSLELNSDYGVIGVNPSQSHGTYTVTGGIRFPIFESGRIRADVDQADALLAQRRAEYADIKGRAEQDVRTAVLDLTTASQQVRVAESNRALAADTLQQSRDRFRSGVADTVEVVQAQEAVASAEQDFISALFAFNLAQVTLARATGRTEQGVIGLLQGK